MGYRAGRTSNRGRAPRKRRSAWPGSPSRRSRGQAEKRSVSAAAHAVRLLIAFEVVLVGLEMGHTISIREVEEVLGLRRVDAREQSRLAGIADRPRGQTHVIARVVGSVELQLRVCRLRREPAERVEKGGIDAEGHADLQAVVVDAAN